MKRWNPSVLNVNDVMAYRYDTINLLPGVHASGIVPCLQFIILYIMYDETTAIEPGSELGLIGGSRENKPSETRGGIERGRSEGVGGVAEKNEVKKRRHGKGSPVAN